MLTINKIKKKIKKFVKKCLNYSKFIFEIVGKKLKAK